MSWLYVLWVSMAGSAGAVTRFVVDGAVRARFGRRFPVGTFIINVTGSLLLGLLTGLVLFRHEPGALTTVAGTGFCGGYTTFSAASFETVRFLQRRAYALAALNGAGSLLLSLAAAAAGLALSRS